MINFFDITQEVFDIYQATSCIPTSMERRGGKVHVHYTFDNEERLSSVDVTVVLSPRGDWSYMASLTSMTGVCCSLSRERWLSQLKSYSSDAKWEKAKCLGEEELRSLLSLLP